MPDVPLLPAFPLDPAVPLVPELPEVPDSPELPGPPEIPFEPAEPEEPEVPLKALAPNKPVIPEEPEDPFEPDVRLNPEEPILPLVPFEPEVPEVPEGHYEHSNMSKTVVPNRNKIFSSIIQAVALSIAEQKDTECAIAMGIHAGDHAIYPDCRQEFRDADFVPARTSLASGIIIKQTLLERNRYRTPQVSPSASIVLIGSGSSSIGILYTVEDQLIAAIGKPQYAVNDAEDKINLLEFSAAHIQIYNMPSFIWDCQTNSGKVFTIYDWNEYRVLDPNEKIKWHIGGFSFMDTMEAKNELITQIIKNKLE